MIFPINLKQIKQIYFLNTYYNRFICVMIATKTKNYNICKLINCDEQTYWAIVIWIQHGQVEKLIVLEKVATNKRNHIKWKL